MMKQLRFFTTRDLRILREGPMPQLPPEIIYEIATHLQEELNLVTLAKLNRVCKIVQEFTQPLLFDTMVLRHDQGFSWQELHSRAGDGLKHTRVLLSNEQTFQDFQTYIRAHPSNAGQTDASADFIFPRLALVVIHGSPEEGRIIKATREITMAAACQLHIYGSISPADVVYACRYPSLLSSPDESDAGSDCSVDSVAWSADESVDVDVDIIVLHKNARLLMENCVYPTSVDVFLKTSGRALDLRLYDGGEFMRETLDLCFWLFNEGDTGCERDEETDNMSKTAKVLCSWNMIQPVVETFRTQRPIPLEFDLGLAQPRLLGELPGVTGVILSMPDRMAVFKRGNTFLALGGSAGTPRTQTTWQIGMLMLGDLLSDEDVTFGLVMNADFRLAFERFGPRGTQGHGEHVDVPTAVTAPDG